ncbi:MAG: glycosyltransferase [Cyanobacteria bacterium]|jgi:glycosyltransferase involved in cell wall biosynthesis|nr:glycosyltransferase [Cyanobacteria bacterium GSL.Bin1]
MTKISVILPVYNVEHYIAQAVQSVLNQTYKNFELLIIDDESPDRSIEICRTFQDPRIKIIHQKNRGLAGARNTGIRHATGDYLAFLDSDDAWLPEKLEKHLAHLEANPQVGVSFSRSGFMDETGQPTGYYQMPKLTGITPEYLLCRNPIGNGSAPVIRREVMSEISFSDAEEVHYFDETFRQSEDIECWLRIAILTDWEIEGLPEALTLYRVNAGGLSASIFKQLASWENVIAKTRTYAPDLLATWENMARAYQLRYLARRAVRLQDGKLAVEFVYRALRTHWQIILLEPNRTILTLIAAYCLWLLPQNWYRNLEASAIALTGTMQQQRISQEAAQ